MPSEKQQNLQDSFLNHVRKQKVYKHAISTIMPGAPIQLFDPEQNQDSD